MHCSEPGHRALVLIAALVAAAAEIGLLAVSSTRRKMKRIIAILALVVAVAIAIVFALPWLHDQSCYRNTVYSVEYAPDAFARITVGTPRTRVVEALGAPLDADGNPSYPVWALSDERVRSRYSSVTNIAVEFLRFSRPKVRTHDFHGFRSPSDRTRQSLAHPATSLTDLRLGPRCLTIRCTATVFSCPYSAVYR